jgi:hypothetical protein
LLTSDLQKSVDGAVTDLKKAGADHDAAIKAINN